MFLSRRDLLGAIAAGGTVLALPRLALADDVGADPTGRTLVLLHLAGGNDGLNTVVPVSDRRYRALRPSLALSTDEALDVGGGLGLHPALAPLHAQLERGNLAIVNGVGYPDPSYSHFRATEIWYTAQPEQTPTLGWMGRALDALPGRRPIRAVALGKEQPLSLVAAGPGVVTLTEFDRFRLPEGLGDIAALYEDQGEQDGVRGEVGRAGAEAIAVARRIASLRPAGGPFPGRLGAEMRKVVSLLEADLGLACIHLTQGGYDTHANQAGQHRGLLLELARNLDAFQQRLEERGLADRVVTVVFSEFGRRPAENLSAGTDHGAAGPVFVLGQGVQAGLHGAYPSLEDLDRDNLRFTTDFRRIYAALLDHALGLDPATVLGADHRPLELFA